MNEEVPEGLRAGAAGAGALGSDATIIVEVCSASTGSDVIPEGAASPVA